MFVLFCEGKNTEPGYFDAIDRLWASALVNVQSVPGVGVPSTIANKATEHARSLRRRRKDSFEEGDEVWAVFDRDEHHRFEEAVRTCEHQGVKVARSDPCFELWLVLHERDYDAPCTRHHIQHELGLLRSDYDKDGAKDLDFDEIVARVHEAEERARTQLIRRRDEGTPYKNPSTTVGDLTVAIRQAHGTSR